MKRRIALAISALLLLTGCGAGRQTAPDAAPDPFRQDSRDETPDTAQRDDDMAAQAAEAMRPRPTLVIEAGGSTFYASFADCAAAEELAAKLSEGPLELQLHDYGGFEKVGELPWPLTRSDASIVTAPGDVILYQGTQISIYYDENTWSLTRMASIGGVSRETLLDAFGDGDVTVTLWVEWSE